MIAAIYARKSTEQKGVNEEDKSVARQVDHARAYAAIKDWTIDEAAIFVDDGISGAEFDDRPGLVRLLNALKPRPPFAALIMMDSSRLGRDMIPTTYALQKIIDAGVRVFFYLEDREATLGTPIEQITQSLMAFGSAVQREQARQSTRDALIRKARAAHVTGGRCFGYDNVDVMSGQVDQSGRPKRSHVERRINEAEADVIRRIFQLCAEGLGKHRIARRLNDSGAPAPQAQLRRPVGWCASSVREALYRELYRGVVVWNKTITRKVRGKFRQIAQPASEWIRVPAPALRIVSEELWEAVHVRLSNNRVLYLRSTGGRLWGRPLDDVEAKYLLSGLAECGTCGGTLEVRSRAHRHHRKHFYMCSTHRRKGPAICRGIDVPLERADAAVLATLEEAILRRDLLQEALLRALTPVPADADAPMRLEALERRLAVLQAQLHRLTELAIAGDGGDLRVLRDAMKIREDEARRIERELARAAAPAAEALPHPRAAAALLDSLLGDWQATLHKHPGHARQMVRKLLRDRLVFTAEAHEEQPGYRVRGSVTMEPLINVVLKGDAGALRQMPQTGGDCAQWVASPTGFEPVSRP